MRISNNAGELVSVGFGGSADPITTGANPENARGRNAKRGAAVRFNSLADPTGDEATAKVFFEALPFVSADEIKALLANPPRTLQLVNHNGDLYDVEFDDAAAWLAQNRRASVR